MLDQHHLEQHHRVDAGAPIILTVQGFYHFVEPVKTYRRIYFSQQMVSRHQLVYDYELYQISIHFPTFQHLLSPLSILPYLSEKAQLQPDFFDMLSCRGVDLPGGFLRSAEGWIPAEKCPKEMFLRALRVFGRNQLLFPRYASFTRLSASSSAPVPDMVMVPVSST